MYIFNVSGDEMLRHNRHCFHFQQRHYGDVIMSAMAFQVTGVSIVYSKVFSGADQRKYQRPASLAFVIWPMNSPHKRPVTRKMFPFDDVILASSSCEPVIMHHNVWLTDSFSAPGFWSHNRDVKHQTWRSWGSCKGDLSCLRKNEFKTQCKRDEKYVTLMRGLKILGVRLFLLYAL